MDSRIVTRPGSWHRYNTSDPVLRGQIDFVQMAGHTFAHPDLLIDRRDFDSLYLSVTLAGRGCVETGGVRQDIGPGEAFWLDCRLPHRYWPQGDEWETLWVHLGGPNIRSLLPVYTSTVPRVFQGETSDALRREIETVHRAVRSREAGRPRDLVLHRHILRMLALLVGVRPRDAYVPSAVRDATAWLTAHYDQPLSLDDLARAVGRSKYHLIRQFREAMGETPARYLTKLRIDAAKTLLEDDDLSLEEIARRTGFSNATGLIRNFKAKEGMTPGRFRRMVIQGRVD